MLENHGMTRGEAMRRGGKPGEAKAAMGNTRPDDEEQGGDGMEGDGNHHHEIIKHEDGGYSSIHTHPDGNKEPMEHGSYDEAKDHMDSMMGEEGDGDADDQSGSDMPSGGGDDGDLAGMYAEHCK